MSELALSIIIVNFNTFDLTCDCIASIKKYTVGVEFEIIVVDNHSQDEAPEKFLQIFPDLILISNLENVGFAKANNIGLKKAKGNYIFLLNSDTYLIENSLKQLLDFVQHHNKEKIGVVSPRVIYPDGRVQHVAQRFPGITVGLLELLRLQKFFPWWGAKMLLGPFFDHKTTTCADWVWGTCFLLKKEVLEQLPENKLDDSYFMYGEDMQWCMDIKKLGYKICFFAETSIVHLKGASNGAQSKWMQENLELFMDRNYNAAHKVGISWIKRMLNWSLSKKAIR